MGTTIELSFTVYIGRDTAGQLAKVRRGAFRTKRRARKAAARATRLLSRDVDRSIEKGGAS